MPGSGGGGAPRNPAADHAYPWLIVIYDAASHSRHERCGFPEHGGTALTPQNVGILRRKPPERSGRQ